MLSKPQHGWTHVTLGELCFSLSYITNIPLEWLDRAIFGMETLLPFEVSGYCEPGRMVCTVDLFECRIVFENDRCRQNNRISEVAPINMLDFCKKLHEDITDHMDDWLKWNPYYSLTKEELLSRLDRLKKLIQVKASCFS